MASSRGATLPTRSIGDRSVGAIGLGAMQLGIEGRPEARQAIRTLHAALDAGCTLIDTADVYCTSPSDLGYRERIVGEALRRAGPDRVLVATKGGHVMLPDRSPESWARAFDRRFASSWPWRRDGRPEQIRVACERSLRALRVEVIGLYQLHGPDPGVPLEETIGAFGELRREGKILQIGLCNVGRKQIERARAEAPIVSVQNELNPDRRQSLPVLEYCRTQGLAFLPWSPRGGGAGARTLGEGHPTFAAVARRHGASPQQVTLAWELRLGPHVIPVPGASRPETMLDSLAAAGLELSQQDLEALAV